MESNLKDKQEAYYNLQRTNNEYYYQRKKKMRLVIFLFILFSLIIKIFVGTIEINSKFGFTNNLGHEIKVNDVLTGTSVGSVKTTPIIPFFVNILSYNMGVTKGENLVTKSKIEMGNKIILDIEAFKCYAKIAGRERQLECTYDNDDKTKKKVKNADYTMRINKTSGKDKGLIYEGKYKKDITDLLIAKGNYEIAIHSKYKNIESDIYFFIELY